PLVLFAVPDDDRQTNRFAVELPRGAALILRHSIDGELKGIDAFKDHPPVAPLFFAFRVMVGTGVLMLLLSWGSLFFMKDPPRWLPLVFAALMGLAILAYVVLDGYDLGVGMLMAGAERAEQDLMVASIGPFWDANETWLVLGIGLLLAAFPAAHGVVLGALYLPVAAMLVGLMLRG